MTTAIPALPGKLGDPSLTLARDPRLHPRLAARLGDAEAPTAPVGPDSAYPEIL